MTSRTPIAQDIKQQRPFKNKSVEAAIALLRTANLLHRRSEAVVSREGLSLAQYNVLRILRGAKSPLPTMEIAERLVEHTPGITRLVNHLEERGLLRREQWPGDRRQILCQITPAGLRILENLDEAVDDLDTASTGALTEQEIDRLLDYLAEIRRANSG